MAHGGFHGFDPGGFTPFPWHPMSGPPLHQQRQLRMPSDPNVSYSGS